MIMPVKFTKYSDALRAGTEIFHSLKVLLKKKGYNTAIGDEGGFAPNLKSNEEALEIILKSIEDSGYIPGKNIYLALDVAASEFYNAKLKKYTIPFIIVVKRINIIPSAIAYSKLPILVSKVIAVVITLV